MVMTIMHLRTWALRQISKLAREAWSSDLDIMRSCDSHFKT